MSLTGPKAELSQGFSLPGLGRFCEVGRDSVQRLSNDFWAEDERRSRVTQWAAPRSIRWPCEQREEAAIDEELVAALLGRSQHAGLDQLRQVEGGGLALGHARVH